MTIEVDDFVRRLCSGPNAKRAWKTIYRKMRISRREAKKATLDMLYLGIGFVMVPNDGGDPYRVHPKDITMEIRHDNQSKGIQVGTETGGWEEFL